MAAGGSRLSVFPLAGALLFPRMQLPLHIFEPRYRALISDAMARDRRIGMASLWIAASGAALLALAARKIGVRNGQ